MRIRRHGRGVCVCGGEVLGLWFQVVFKKQDRYFHWFHSCYVLLRSMSSSHKISCDNILCHVMWSCPSYCCWVKCVVLCFVGCVIVVLIRHHLLSSFLLFFSFQTCMYVYSTTVCLSVLPSVCCVYDDDMNR